MATNLKKLKIFKHFYIMVICYIYFTRIIGFLLKQMLPFRYEWFDELCTEVVTFTFFAMTAYKFQPASNNPYLQVSQNDLDEEEIANLNGEEFQLSGAKHNDAYLTGNEQTVLDLIDPNYRKTADQVNGSSNGLLPSGPDSSNPTLFSRKLQNSPNN
jgi:hypothetical protein